MSWTPEWVLQMNEHEDRDLADLDLYIRFQLHKAAETYAAHADLDVRLAAALLRGEQRDDDDPDNTRG